MRRRQFIVLLGGGAVWPVLGQAQQPTVPTIGFMSGRSPDEFKHLVAAFHQGLGEAGFVAGKNVAVEYRWALGQYDRLPALAADLVKRDVAVLVAVGGNLRPWQRSKRPRRSRSSLGWVVMRSGPDWLKVSTDRAPTTHVRFGPKADMCSAQADVR